MKKENKVGLKLSKWGGESYLTCALPSTEGTTLKSYEEAEALIQLYFDSSFSSHSSNSKFKQKVT